MDDSTVRELFQRISSDDTLRRSLLEALQPPPEDEDTTAAKGRDQTSDQTMATNRPASGDGSNDTPQVADAHQSGGNASLVADERQSRGIGEQGADVPLSTSNPPGSQDGNAEGSSRHSSEFSSSLFDPGTVTSESEYTFDTHEVITGYLETHFWTSLDKKVRNSMHKTHPVPNTPIMKAPKVDRFMLDHLKQNYPRSRDTELSTIQSALLSG